MNTYFSLVYIPITLREAEVLKANANILVLTIFLEHIVIQTR